jgi:hypothetical protein
LRVQKGPAPCSCEQEVGPQQTSWAKRAVWKQFDGKDQTYPFIWQLLALSLHIHVEQAFSKALPHTSSSHASSRPRPPSQAYTSQFILNHTASLLLQRSPLLNTPDRSASDAKAAVIFVRAAGYDGHSDVSAGYPSGGCHGVRSSLRLRSKHGGVCQALASPA